MPIIAPQISGSTPNPATVMFMPCVQLIGKLGLKPEATRVIILAEKR